jgi:hypothetical protein
MTDGVLEMSIDPNSIPLQIVDGLIAKESKVSSVEVGLVYAQGIRKGRSMRPNSVAC